MDRFVYTPDLDLKVHEEGAIRLICRAFQSHENGLPEWLKNSADAYAREDAPEAKRVIITIFNFDKSAARPSISCLDFSGMTSQMIEENFRIWADPEAALRGAKAAGIQGGHGNGGKCYMTQMFEDHALIRTVKRDNGNCYGVEAGSLKFGYIPDRKSGRDFPVTNLRQYLENCLAPIGCQLHSLPTEAAEALKMADGFSLVTGVGPTGYGQKIPFRQLISNLRDHPQMIKTLELCKIFIIINGKLSTHSSLALPVIKPMEGAEQPRTIQIPVKLKDPFTGLEVSTTKDETLPPGILELRTSQVSMRSKWRMRHNILYNAKSGYIGYVPVSELDVQSSYRDRIYGKCILEALEPDKQNERGPLANSDLTRAVKAFISEQVQAFAEEFEIRDRRRIDQEEKDTIT